MPNTGLCCCKRSTIGLKCCFADVCAKTTKPASIVKMTAARIMRDLITPPSLSVGPTVRIASVRCFAASLPPAGTPTPSVPRRAHRPDRFGTLLRSLLTSGRSPHALCSASGPPSGSLRYCPGDADPRLFQFFLDTVQNAVDELWRFLSTEPPGDLNRLVDDHSLWRFFFVKEF